MYEGTLSEIVSRVVRIAAVFLILAALWPRGVARHERVLVFAIEGLDFSILHDTLHAGEMPVLRSVVDSGVRIGLHGWRVGDRSEHWRALFEGVDAGVSDRPAAGVAGEPVWDELVRAGGSALVVAVPGVEAREGPHIRVLAGVDPAMGIEGDSAGQLVNGATVLAGELAWPYVTSADAAARAAGRLKRGEWSDWIHVPLGSSPARDGSFRLFRVDAERFYLTPVFLSGIDPHAWDEAPWALAGPGFEQLEDAVSDAARAKFQVALDAAGPEWDLTVYFDTLAASATRSHARLTALQARAVPGRYRTREESLAEVRKDYSEVDHQLGELRAKSGDRTCVAVLLEGSAAYDGPGGIARNRAELVVDCDSGREGRAEASFVDVAPTLRYLLGLPANSGRVIASVAARCWTAHAARRAVAALQRPAVPSGLVRPFGADALVDLGTVPNSAASE